MRLEFQRHTLTILYLADVDQYQGQYSFVTIATNLQSGDRLVSFSLLWYCGTKNINNIVNHER